MFIGYKVVRQKRVSHFVAVSPLVANREKSLRNSNRIMNFLRIKNFDNQTLSAASQDDESLLVNRISKPTRHLK